MMIMKKNMKMMTMKKKMTMMIMKNKVKKMKGMTLKRFCRAFCTWLLTSIVNFYRKGMKPITRREQVMVMLVNLKMTFRMVICLVIPTMTMLLKII